MKNAYKEYFDITDISARVKEYLPTFDEIKFLKAFEFASKAHEGQLRKDKKTPYIEHPVRVVEILAEFHADEDTLISTILHDVPEDTKYTIGDVRERFGEKVAFLVNGITKLSKVYYKHDMSELQVRSLKKLFLHSAEDLRVILIKLADRLHNMRTLKNIPAKEKRMRISRETLEIYAPIANLLGIQELKHQLEDLCFEHLFPTEYQQVYQKRKEGLKTRKEVASKLIKTLEDECAKQKLKAKIFDRKKNLYTIYRKIRSQGTNLDAVDNRVSLRFVVDTDDDCYKALGIVHSKFRPKNDRFRDYIATPKANGYRSLHTTVFGPYGLLTEVQIRTEEMNLDSNYGIAAGFFIDNKIATDHQRVAWVKRILEIEKSETKSGDFLGNLKLDVFQERIIVFTPKGKPMDLPRGASVLDFAYAIHSEIGHHAIKANINGRSKNINATLNTGDVVDVITSYKSTPDLSWLSFVKTGLARDKILSYLKRVSNDKKIREGEKILQREFDILGLGLFRNMSFKKLNTCIERTFGYNFDNIEALLKSVGTGDLRATDVGKALKSQSSQSKSARKRTDHSGENVRVSMKILAKNRFGLMNDISEVIYDHVLDIFAFKGWVSRQNREAHFTVEVLAKDMQTVSHLFDQLEQVDDIVHVYRFTKKSLWTISFLAILTALFWIFHPLLLIFMERNALVPLDSLHGQIVSYGSLFVLVFAVLYLTGIFRKYFPYARKGKRLWIVSFFIPLFATFTLAVEIWYFDVHLNWGIILIQVLLVYLFLFISFLNFRKTMKKIESA